MARLAAVDIGSNAIRLRMVEVDPGSAAGASRPDWPSGAWKEIGYQRAPVRLGRDVFRIGALAPAEIVAACDALARFRKAMDEAGVDGYRAVATSAVREAANKNALVEQAERRARIAVEIIEGVEEARLVQLAVRRRLDLSERKALLVDIGGGSTELSVLQRGRCTFSRSLPVGTVRLMETFLDADRPVSGRQSDLMRAYVDRVLGEALRDLPRERVDLVVGTGGNVNAVAAVCPTTTPDGPAVDVGEMRARVARLGALAPEDRAKQLAIPVERADVIVPAAVILLQLAEAIRIGALVAPGVGLKEGILEEMCAKTLACWDFEQEADGVLHAAAELGRRYRFDESHARRVAHLALRLFDDLRELHGLAARERLLLHAGALLHDIGDFVRYEGHHKHGQYIVEHSDIMGLGPSERRVVACLVRYHRKGPPSPAHAGYGDLGRSDRNMVKLLAPLVRIADALDREHRSRVTDVRATVDKARVRLVLEGDTDRELEEWTVAHKAGLFREVYDRDVVVGSKP